MIFSLKNISKKYGDKEVLYIDKLDIKSGEVYCISGPNGSGKSTLLEILSGISLPTNGMVTYNNDNTLKRGYGQIILVPQNTIVFNTSVYANIAFGLKANKIPLEVHKEKITKVLKKKHIEDVFKISFKNK